MKLKDRWKSKSPKWAKILGNVSVIIAIIGTALSYAYVDVPEELKEFIPEVLAKICAIGGFVSRLLLQFTVINKIFDKDRQVLTTYKKRNKKQNGNTF